MPVSRRQLIGLAGGVLGAAATGFTRLPVIAKRRGALVVVRTERGVRAVDPRSGDTAAWTGNVPGTPATGPVPAPPPAVLATPVTGGAIGYWMSTPAGDAWVFRLDTGAHSRWWWRRSGNRGVALDLSGDLEPAFPSGAAARWFHGAAVDAAHLGSGTLRLLAVELVTGRIVLDRALDRRLELAATKVSPDGAIVAHVQSSTTGASFWAADLRGGTRLYEAEVVEAPGVAAASAIDLAVAADGDAVLVAAGLSWAWPGAPDPTVLIMRADSPDAVAIRSVPGELVGIVPVDAPGRSCNTFQVG